MKATSHFADAAAARQAIDIALPMIEAALRDPAVCGSGFLVIVVLDPGMGPTQGTLDQAVLLEHCIGDRHRWDADYGAFARAKAAVAWTHGMDSCVVQGTRAHLLRDGDTLLWGSVCLDGIVVGVSGAHPWWDEAFATAVASNLRAIAKARHAQALQQSRLTA
jgi:hypothetical protein